jgi:hypothetical protein
MGAWGHLAFDDDWAADWVYEVEEGADLASVRSKLSEVAGSVGKVSSRLGSEGAAAAEILAICIGHGFSVVPTRLSRWITELDDRPTNEDLEDALAAVDRIRSMDSELRELWGERGDIWLHYMEGMMERLRMTADRETYLTFESMGPDLTRSHTADWFLYLPTEQSANRIGKLLSSEGCVVDVHRLPEDQRDGDTFDWSVVASRTLIPTYMLLMRYTNRIQQICETEGGSFDGWGIALESEST